MKSLPLTVVALTATISMSAVTAVSPAQAAPIVPCAGSTSDIQAADQSTYSTKPSTCDSTQARIDRYIAVSPTSYYGSWGSSSYVSASSGVNSGNYARWNSDYSGNTKWMRKYL